MVEHNERHKLRKSSTRDISEGPASLGSRGQLFRTVSSLLIGHVVSSDSASWRLPGERDRSRSQRGEMDVRRWANNWFRWKKNIKGAVCKNYN